MDEKTNKTLSILEKGETFVLDVKAQRGKRFEVESGKITKPSTFTQGFLGDKHNNEVKVKVGGTGP